jgi:hypothetical protein
MKYFMEYVKAGYEVVMIAEQRSNIMLEHEIEAWLVHVIARYMETPDITKEPIAIKMLTAVNESGELRKQRLQQIAEECLLIDGFELNRGKWPSHSYYHDMGKLALEHRAWTPRPPELFYQRIANQFSNISQLLHSVKLG